MELKLPDSIKYALNKLNECGYEAYVVGGCVRDLLLGIEPHDYDITTSALPFEIKNVFSNYKIIDTGIKHGTVTIIIEKMPIEITTFRADGEYKDNRHPAEVKFISNLELDLMRRDFTINAMAYNDSKGLVDLFGGIKDIENKIIRCVGNSDERFAEDALRILRAIRFAFRFNCGIDATTMESMLRHKSLLKNISIERVCSELTKTLSYPNKIESTELITLLIELIKPIVKDIYFIDTDDVCQRLIESPSIFEIRLATLLDLNNIEIIMKRLRFSNDDVYNVASIRQYGHKIINEQLSWKGNNGKYYSRKLLHDIGYKNAIYAVEYAILLAHKQDSDLMTNLLLLRNHVYKSGQDDSAYTLSGLNVNGNDLLELGYRGRQIGYTLNYLLDIVMQDMIPNSKKELINYIKNNCSKEEDYG